MLFFKIYIINAECTHPCAQLTLSSALLALLARAFESHLGQLTPAS